MNGIYFYGLGARSPSWVADKMVPRFSLQGNENLPVPFLFYILITEEIKRTGNLFRDISRSFTTLIKKLLLVFNFLNSE